MQASATITDNLSDLTRRGICDGITQCFVGRNHVNFREPFYTQRHALHLGTDRIAQADFSRRYLKMVTALALHCSLYMTVSSAAAIVAQMLVDSPSARVTVREEARSMRTNTAQVFIGLVRGVTMRAISDVFYAQDDTQFHYAYAELPSLRINIESTLAFMLNDLLAVNSQNYRHTPADWIRVRDRCQMYSIRPMRIDLTVSCENPNYYH